MFRTPTSCTKPIISTGAVGSNILKLPTRGNGMLLLLVFIFMMGWAILPCHGFGTFEFRVHHRLSDPVKQILDVGYSLPEKGTVDYFTALTRRDVVSHGGRFYSPAVPAAANQSLVTFSSGNSTHRLSFFGFLYYANVTVGTPGLSFLVALDTGSSLFWLPCDCQRCVQGVRFGSQEIDFNIYSLSTSSTGKKVLCKSSLCQHHRNCSASQSKCPYDIEYLSANTSSSGYLVEDVLHLTADDISSKPLKPLNAEISIGCGMIQTGSFLEGGAPNGLLGLGLDNISVPSMLASQKIAANSFSMCFGDDGKGRITFGDRGQLGQGETPFNTRTLQPHYNISITEIIIGSNVSNVDGIYAIFDTGTSFTYLNDPAYTWIAENFNSQVKDKRLTSIPGIPFEYCFESSSRSSSLNIPDVNLTMQGGHQFFVTDPTVLVSLPSGLVYCLGIGKSDSVNIIGQNFMSGYRVVFDRERMVLGWKASDCNEALNSSLLPISPQSSRQIPHLSPIQSEAEVPSINISSVTGVSSTLRRDLLHVNSWMCTLVFIALLIWSIF